MKTAMPNYKERVGELRRESRGYFMLERDMGWTAYDAYGKYICHCRTKAECIAAARRQGYAVPDDVIRGR